MNRDYQFVDLSEEDQRQVQAMEQSLGQKYHREIVLIAYEKRGTTAGAIGVDVRDAGVSDRETPPLPTNTSGTDTSRWRG